MRPDDPLVIVGATAENHISLCADFGEQVTTWPQLTVRVSVALWMVLPDVPVTVTL